MHAQTFCLANHNYFCFFPNISVSGFEFTSESGLFDLLDVQLYHGWLGDPQDHEIYEVVKQYSYNQLVEIIINSKSSDDHKKIREGRSIHAYILTLYILHVLCCDKVKVVIT